MAVDLNTIDGTVDVYCIDDFLPNMPTVSGRVALVHRLIRRITTRRGQLPFWEDDGIDVRDALLSKRRPSDVAAEVQTECRKDEQVESITVFAEFEDDGQVLTLSFEVDDGEAPFTFTLEIDAAQATLVELLNAA